MQDTGLPEVLLYIGQKRPQRNATAEIWPQVTDLKEEAKQKRIKNIVFEKLDVTNKLDRDFIHAKYDVDILFSNAGLMEAGSIGEQPVDIMRSIFEINVFDALEFAQDFIKKMMAKNLVQSFLLPPWRVCLRCHMLLHILQPNTQLKQLQKV